MIKKFFDSIPFREILVGIISSLLSTVLIISYTKYKQAETMFVQIRKEIKVSAATIHTLTLDKNLGTPLALDIQVPNKYWDQLTSDDQNALNLCDPSKNVEKFYTNLNVLRTYYDLVSRSFTSGRPLSFTLAKSIDQEQLIVSSAASPAEETIAACRDALLPNKIKRTIYRVLGKT